jgi:hypothetical protein
MNRINLGVEQLETREVLSTSAISNLGGTLVQFNWQSGDLMMTQGQTTKDLGQAQGLFQGKDASGHQLAFELMNQQLSEFNGSTFVPLAGTPAAILSDFNTLMIYGGNGHLQIGSYIQADVNVQIDSHTGSTQVDFNNVQINLSKFAGDFLGKAVSTLQSFTKDLEPLAKVLNKKLIDAGPESLTTIALLKDVAMFKGPDYLAAAQTAESLAKTIDTINTNLPALLPSTDGIIRLGNFSAQINATGGLTTLNSTVSIDTSAASEIQTALGGFSDMLKSMHDIGADIKLDDPRQLLKLVTGEAANLMTYTPSYNINLADFSQRLASIPISPETGTELDIDLVGRLNLTVQATVGFDTSGFAKGNLADGFFIQNAKATMDLKIGPAGTLNEADLIGYRVAGVLDETVKLQLEGAAGSTGVDPTKIYARQIESGQVKIVVTPQTKYQLECTKLGPQQMLGIAIQQAPAQAKQIVDAVGKYLGIGADAVKTALKNNFGQVDSTAAQALNKLGVQADHLASILNAAYGTSSQGCAKILHDLKVGANDAAAALQTAYQEGNKAVASDMHKAQYTASEIAGALKSDFSAVNQDIASILSGLQIAPGDIFWTISGLPNQGVVAGLNAMVGAGLLTNSGNAAANFLLTQAKDSLSDSTATLYHWLTGNNKLHDTFWSIASVGGYGMVGGLNGLVQAGLMTNSGNAAATFLLNTAQASLASTATAIYGWVNGNKAYNTFWSIANGAGKGVANALSAMVGAGFVANDSFVAATFLLNTAQTSLGGAAIAISSWLGGNRTAAFWAIATGAKRGYADGVRGLLQGGLLGNDVTDVYNFLKSVLNPSDTLTTLKELGFSVSAPGGVPSIPGLPSITVSNGGVSVQIGGTTVKF